MFTFVALIVVWLFVSTYLEWALLPSSTLRFCGFARFAFLFALCMVLCFLLFALNFRGDELLIDWVPLSSTNYLRGPKTQKHKPQRTQQNKEEKIMSKDLWFLCSLCKELE